mmetsp:Transcript_111792/g.315768  ORF Transcript_111792/g.315768 Transcript_111792/m.315768 type:complete len:207 (+) Transcript_111792:33-653(+)
MFSATFVMASAISSRFLVIALSPGARSKLSSRSRRALRGSRIFSKTHARRYHAFASAPPVNRKASFAARKATTRLSRTSTSAVSVSPPFGLCASSETVDAEAWASVAPFSDDARCLALSTSSSKAMRWHAHKFIDSDTIIGEALQSSFFKPVAPLASRAASAFFRSEGSCPAVDTGAANDSSCFWTLSSSAPQRRALLLRNTSACW